MQTPTDIKRDPWRLVIESVVLLSTFFVAYGSRYEIINAVVGLHFVHVITITLISINGTRDQGTRKMIDEYFSTYSTVTTTLDCLALFLVAVRTALATRLNIYLTLEQLVYTVLYVVHVVTLIAIDIYNLTHPLSEKMKDTVNAFWNLSARKQPTVPIAPNVPTAPPFYAAPTSGQLHIRIPPLRLGPPVDMSHPSLRYRSAGYHV